MKIISPQVGFDLETDLDLEEVVKQHQKEETPIRQCHFQREVLGAVDLSGLRYERVIFENCRLTHCSFQKSTFIDVVFQGCDFSNSDFRETYFNRCTWQTTKGLGINFNESIFYHTQIQDAHLRYANFSGAKFDKVSVAQSNFSEAFLNACEPKAIRFDGVDFRGASFFKTPLQGLDLSSCSIEGLLLSDDGTELPGVIVDLYQAAELAKYLGIVIK